MYFQEVALDGCGISATILSKLMEQVNYINNVREFSPRLTDRGTQSFQIWTEHRPGRQWARCFTGLSGYSARPTRNCKIPYPLVLLTFGFQNPVFQPIKYHGNFSEGKMTPPTKSIFSLSSSGHITVCFFLTFCTEHALLENWSEDASSVVKWSGGKFDDTAFL